MVSFFGDRLFLPIYEGMILVQLYQNEEKAATALTADDRFIEYLKITGKRCHEAGLDLSADMCLEETKICMMMKEKGESHTSAALTMRIHDLIRLMYREMKKIYFIGISAQERKKYMVVHPFGEDVHRKFERIESDVFEAAHCLVLGCPTASVFHLMRVMEQLTQRFADKMGLKIKKKHRIIAIKDAEWNDILVAAHTQIATERRAGNLTSQRKRKLDRYEEVAIHLEHIKNAWRNPTMHPHESYNDLEAQNIFNLVGDYVRTLTKIL